MEAQTDRGGQSHLARLVGGHPGLASACLHGLSNAERERQFSHTLQGGHFATPSFPRRRESRAIAGSSDRGIFIYGVQVRQGHVLDSRLRGNDGLTVPFEAKSTRCRQVIAYPRHSRAGGNLGVTATQQWMEVLDSRLRGNDGLTVPFEAKSARLVVELNAQFAESAKLEKIIKANLGVVGHGS